MSGPWDRPSPDREPPASNEDAAPERSDAGRSSGDAWPSSDLWPDQRPESGSAWDDWSTLRAPDDFVVEPVSTLGDPWAESWADESSGRDEDADEGPSPSADAPDRWETPPPDDGWSPAAAEEGPAVADEPAPSGWEPAAERAAPAEPDAGAGTVEPEPAPWQPEPEAPAWQPTPEPSTPEPAPEPAPGVAAWQPDADADPWAAPPPVGSDAIAPTEAIDSGPSVAPWQASDDPWGAVAEPEPAAEVEPPVAGEAATAVPIDVASPQTTVETEPSADAADAAEAPAVAPSTEATALAAGDVAPEPETSTGGWRRDLLPAWLTGRSAAATPEPPAVDESEDAPAVAEADAAAAEPEASEPASEPAAPVDAEIGETAVGAGYEADAGEAAAFVAQGEAEPPVAEPDAFVAQAEPEPPVAELDGEPEPFVAELEPEPFVAELEPEVQGVPSADEATPVVPVAWEEDGPGDIAGSAAAEETGPAVDETGTRAAVDEDAAAAAELESAPGVAGEAWPTADLAGAEPLHAQDEVAAAPDLAEEERDRRFDAFLGTPVIGAAAAADLGEEPLDLPGVDTVDEPALAPTDRSDDAGAAVSDAPADAPSAAEAESEVTAPDAAPEATELAAAPSAEAGPDTEAEAGPATEAEAVDPAEAWRAAAAAAAAAAVVRRAEIAPEMTSPEGAAEADTGGPPPVEDAMTEAPQAPPPAEQQPTWRPDWLPDVEELEADDRTSVLPTDWTPPPPAPVAPVDRGSLAPHATATRTRPASDVDRDLEDELEPDATTAEQAVPWLIGFILLLAGMVIVLLALIFAGDASLGGGGGEPTPQPSLAGGAVATPLPTAVPVGVVPSTAPSASAPAASSSPTESAAAPVYGPLEMVYQGRSTALAPIYLLRRDFTEEPEPTVLAQDPNLDLRRYSWAMDGTRGAGLYADLLVSIEAGVEKRQLGDEIDTITFGSTHEKVYAVRVTEDGANDVAVVLAVDFETGDTSELARFTYPRPAASTAASLKQAQYEDEGGSVRLFWMEDNQLRLWVLNGGMWEIDPDTGESVEVPRKPPVLWSPDGRYRIVVTEDGTTSTLSRIDMEGDEISTTTVEGLVSHLRWSPQADRVVFTVGRSASAGGVLQDLWLWDLGEEPPTQITATGAAFGAEWLGSRVRWREDVDET